MSIDYRGSVHPGQLYVGDLSKLKVLGKYVLVKPDWDKEYRGKAIIVQDNNEDHLWGEVVGVGCGTKSGISVGETIIFERFVGHTVPTCDGDMIMITEDNIHLIVE